MNYVLEVLTEADEDIWQAAQWYENRRTGLGMEFSDYVYGQLDDLKESPFIYAPYRIHYRKMNLRRFPYSVIYQVIEAELTVIVIAVLHQKRDSDVLFEE